MSEFSIISIKGQADQASIEEFASFAFKVRKAPFNTGLMSQEQTKRLLFWGLNHGSIFWMVKDKTSKTILRMALRVCPDTPTQGTIGFFEIDLESSNHQEALEYAIREAEKWFRDQNVKQLIAPVDINTWFNYRFSLPSKKFFPRFNWEPTTPPEYLEFFKSAGYGYFAHFNSVFFPHLRIGPFAPGTGHLKRSYKRLAKVGFHLRAFDQENFKSKELPLFYEISHEAFSDALLFEKIDLQTFSELYAGAVATYDFSPSCVLIDPEGNEAGFLFAFFDGDHLVIKSIALRKKYQGLKLSSGMIYSAVEKAFNLNKKFTVSALVRTGLTSEKIAGKSQKWSWFSWTHDYVIVKKDL